MCRATLCALVWLSGVVNMKSWARTSLILCVFGFFKEFVPSEPFVTQYLTGPRRNYTEEQVNQQIFPVATYTHLSSLVLVFLVTDLLRYRPVIIAQGLTESITLSLLIVGQTVPVQQVQSAFFGVFLATDIAFSSYLYAQVEKRYYQRVSSYTRASMLIARFSSGVLGQVLISTSALDHYQLLFISLSCAVAATAWTPFLPPVQHSIYFHSSSVEGSKVEDTLLGKWRRAWALLWSDFRDAFTKWYVVKWSVWFAVATAGYNLNITYSQILWENIVNNEENQQEDSQQLYNGAVEAVYTILAFIGTLCSGLLRFNWEVVGGLALALSAALQGGALLLAAHTSSLWTAYLCYVFFGVVFHSMTTIVTSEIAKNINEDSYGLIFGVTTFLALVLQTTLTVLVVGEGGFALSIRSQFTVYGGQYIALAVVFGMLVTRTLPRGELCARVLWLPSEQGVTEQKKNSDTSPQS